MIFCLLAVTLVALLLSPRVRRLAGLSSSEPERRSVRMAPAALSRPPVQIVAPPATAHRNRSSRRRR